MSKDSYDVFVGYYPEDYKIALETAGKLVQRGFTVWFDRWELVPGKPWQQIVEDAMSSSKNILILINSGRSFPYSSEIGNILLSDIANSDRQIIYLLVDGVEDNTVKGRYEGNAVIDFRSGIDDHAAWNELEQR